MTDNSKDSLKIPSLFLRILKRYNFIPASGHRQRNPEKLTEWMVEGDVFLKINNLDSHHWFSWTQDGPRFKLELREQSIVGPVLAEVKAESDKEITPEVVFHSEKSRTEERIVKLFEEQKFFHFLRYWLRGLSTRGTDAEKKQDTFIETLDENGWHLIFDDFLEFAHYTFPRKIDISSPSGTISFRILRAETGFIHNWCRFNNKKSTTDTKRDKNIDVPEDSMLPRWIDSEQFCKQLEKIHGRVLNPKHGIFGPESMMWEINRHVIPPGIGSGRALLLQISHPWVTAGIDEHSNVRNDPMERARRTFIYMYTIIFGSLPQAMRAANEVHGMHKRINGELPYPAGKFSRQSRYSANEMNAMTWVQATLWDTLVRMYEKTVRKLTRDEKERFYQESKLFAMMFGIPASALPETWDDFNSYCDSMWEGDTLAVTPATKALATELFRKRNPVFFVGMPVLKMITACHLPPRLRKDYELPYNSFTRSFYAVFIVLTKVLHRILPKQLRTNVMYQEAVARINGKESSPMVRKILELGTGMPTMVN